MPNFVRIAPNDWIRIESVDRLTRDAQGVVSAHLRNGELVVVPLSQVGNFISSDPPPPDPKFPPQSGGGIPNGNS